MTGFDLCMEKLDRIEREVVQLRQEPFLMVSPEFVWLWMFCLPALTLVVGAAIAL